MTTELAKVYDPKTVENQVYARWAGAGAFNAEADGAGQTYCIVIPPPNVTAPLHVGHALNNALQDVLIRQKRMQQFNTLWMPGTDHAGIATQTVVEKRILAEEGRRRTDFTREQFVARVQDWKDQYEARIIEQLELMGCSCDWRRTRFTMDEVCARAVRRTFFDLFTDELVFRGKRLVNWDPATQTVLADDEVEYEDVHGHFWYMQYPLVEPIEVCGERIEHVTVATTRPETMLGDTAVAMNPGDPRAGRLVGRQVRLPIVGRLIPIIADQHVVPPDPESDDEKARFSTGFLKVTPAHDPDDYAIGQRHGLAIVNVMAPDGSISDCFGWDDAAGTDAEQLLGMDRFEAREAVLELFRQGGLLKDVREYTHQVGHSYRSHVPIEPYLSDQWYIAVKKPIGRLAEKFGEGVIEGTDVPVNSLAGLALKPLLDGELKFVPERYANTYRTWLENLRDWPISRQLWWGHQIPIWKGASSLLSALGPLVRQPGSQDADSAMVPATLAHKGVTLPIGVRNEEGQEYCYISIPPGRTDIETELEAKGFKRDEDVLDTWFSSALWPFSTLGWPDESPQLQTFYPGDVLCTAREIITLWVSRMVMMGRYCMGEAPFRDVFIHAMIQDGDGRKMSKSLGNGIDPLDIIDSHGADAMRFTLVSMTTQTQDVRMPVEKLTLPDGRKANTSPKFDAGRNLCNKLWNASRFVMMNLTAIPAWSQIKPTAHLADAWIISRLNACVRDSSNAIEAYRFNELADALYHFMWDDFCDWYVEIAKARINAGQETPKAVLAHCLDTLLRLLHPITPFITEAIWSKLNEVAPIRGPGDEQAEDLLITARWPQADARMIRADREEQFEHIRQVARGIRSIRTEHGVAPRKKVSVHIAQKGRWADLLGENTELLESQTRSEVTFVPEDWSAPSDAAFFTTDETSVHVEGVIDRQAEQSRLRKQAETLTNGIRGLMGKLDNEDFLKKAPPEVVRRDRERLQSLQSELDAVSKSLEALG